MRLLSHISREYKGKKYEKFWIVIPNNLVEKLKWKKGQDLEAEENREKLIIKTVAYRVYVLDKFGNRLYSKRLKDRDEFLNEAKLSKTKDKNWDVEINIIPIIRTETKGVTETRDKTKKEVYFGIGKEIEVALKD